MLTAAGLRLPLMPRGLRLLSLLFLLALTAAAVQPLVRVAPDLLYLPTDGVALSARTGHVLWRYPRLDGAVHTNGRGLLLVSRVTAVYRRLNLRFTRICRLRASDGHELWCRDEPDLLQWTLDAGGRRWYAHTPGRLQVFATGDGRQQRSFHLRQGDGLTLLPLPAGGALLLASGPKHSQALVYRAGATALAGYTLPGRVYAFHGGGQGLLLYAPPAGAFFLADPAPVRLPQSEPRFPRASLNRHGFVLTGWRGARPIVRGGTYGGSMWRAPRPAGDAELAVGAGTALLLLRGGVAPGLLRGWDLASGAPRFSRHFPGRGPLLACQGEDLVVTSSAGVWLLDADTGAVRWHARLRADALAAMAASAIVVWDEQGRLVGLDRGSGAPRWRVRFREAGQSAPLP